MKFKAIILFVVILSNYLFAFDVNGYSTNMEISDVKEKLKNVNAKIVTHDANTLVGNFKDGSYLSFNFCENKLKAVNQGHPAEFKNYVLLISEYNNEFGQPFSINSKTSSHATGEKYEMGIWWKNKNEYASVYFMELPDGKMLSTSFQAKNNCFEVLRWSGKFEHEKQFS